MSKYFKFALSAVVFALSAMGQAQAALEKTKVHIAVGGKAAFYYLPLTIAEQLGYFKAEGLDVTISDFSGGSTALRAVVGGSADVVSGAYEHTISLQGKKQFFQAFVLQGRLPQISLGVVSAKAAGYKSPKDLKGMKIGVSAPGSSTNNLVNQLLAQGGAQAQRRLHRRRRHRSRGDSRDQERADRCDFQCRSGDDQAGAGRRRSRSSPIRAPSRARSPYGARRCPQVACMRRSSSSGKIRTPCRR